VIASILDWDVDPIVIAMVAATRRVTRKGRKSCKSFWNVTLMPLNLRSKKTQVSTLRVAIARNLDV
jgi:hypothetical protein